MVTRAGESKDIASCIEACQVCLVACERCIDAHLDEGGMAECTLFPAVFRRYARELAGSGPLWAAGRAEEQYGVVTLNAGRLGRLPAA